MRFSSLIKALQAGESGLRWSQPSHDPVLSGAASLEQAARRTSSAFWRRATRSPQRWEKVLLGLCCCRINRT